MGRTGVRCARVVPRALVLALMAALPSAPVSSEPASPSADAAAHDAKVARQIRDLKALHQEILLGGPARKLQAFQAASRLGRRAWRRALSSHPPRDRAEALGPQGLAGAATGLRATDDPGPLPANVRLNRFTPFQSTQSEATFARNGSQVVAAWNDGENVGGVPSGIGYASSSDGGRTWTPGGPLPRGGGVALWISDPVLAVDGRSGAFYVAGLVIADGPRSGLAVIRGTFQGGSFAWEPPTVVRATRDTFPDKPWLAADSLTGNLYVSYTTFFRPMSTNTDQIEFQRSTDGNQSWTPAVKVSPDEENGMVQGSRPAVGPDGEVHVVWKAIDTTAVAGGLDAMRIRTSRDGGQTFGPPATAARLYTNFCSGPPGFDRGFGLGFPSIAVDRGSGPRRGRVYVAWEEALNFYDDLVATAEEVEEAEPNAIPGQATPFVLGETVRARIGAPQDVDWFRFDGLQGQTAIVFLDSLESRLDVALRLWCVDGSTRLAYSTSLATRRRVVVFTLPRSGDYFVSVAPHNDSTGTYRLATGLAHHGPERGRDHRDVFAAWSDDGVNWSAPARVGDGPAGFDDWLPELAVAGGKPYLAWYDWREGDPAGCGAAAHVRLSRSDDGGSTWTALGRVTDVPTVWPAVSGNLVPNMGDYIALAEDGRSVHPCWADGREGDPDVHFADWPLAVAAHEVQGAGSEVGEEGVVVRWASPGGQPMVATAYRRTASTDWTALGSVASDAQGLLTLLDSAPEPGFRYFYRLGIVTAEGEVPTAEVAVDVPAGTAAGLAIERLAPNPSAGEFRLWFRRPDLAPARIEVMDLAGRRRAVMNLGAEYGARGVVDLGREARLEPGLYVVRLAQGGQVVAGKLVVVR